MATKTKTTKAGPVGIKPRGNWSATYNDGHGYELLALVLHNHDSWVSKVEGNKDEPSTNSTKWQKHSDGGAEAIAAAAAADTAASNANNKAGKANTAAARAEDAAGRTEMAISEAENVNAELVGYDLKVTDRNGNTTTKNVRGEKGDDLDYSTMTPEEKAELSETVIQHIVSENILGPHYDVTTRTIVYPISSGVTYDAENRCIKLG